jgi:glycosyltransferase involved in cell wall biosynthesis
MLGHREALPVLQAADALLLPSAREGFSYSCAEAMCAGVPVLRTRTSGTKELIVEGVTGRSVEIDRAAFVREAMEFLADRPALRSMGTAAAQHIRRSFTFEHQLAQTLTLYQKLIGRA